QSAAGGAGNPYYYKQCTHHRRQRQTRTVLRVHKDCDGPRVKSSNSVDLRNSAGTTAVSHQRAHKKRNDLPGGEVEELPKRQRVRGIGVYQAGGGILGHALSGRPDCSEAPNRTSGDSYTIIGEWRGGTRTSSGTENKTAHKQRTEHQYGEAIRSSD